MSIKTLHIFAFLFGGFLLCAIDLTKYIIFLGSTFIICIIPGPDMLYIIATSIRLGRKAGITAALGISVSMLFYTIVVSCGLAAFFSVSNQAFHLLQVCGGLYLIFVGIQTLSDTELNVTDSQKQSARMTFFQAMFTNLMNPKVIFFYIAYLPQFTNKALGHMGGQLLLLGCSFLLIGLAIDAVIGLLSTYIIGRVAYKSSKFFKILSALIYFALGMYIFFNETFGAI
jgi:threonine/homoserine/homoserine lactone efflux protein